MANGYTIQQAASLSDAELVGRAIGGDQWAFDFLVLRHRETVLRTARASVGDWDCAEDVAQQAFIEALSGLRGLREPARFRPWLVTITRRCAARTFRGPEPALVEFADTVLYPLPALEPNPVLREHIRASLSELSTRSRTVVVLHYLDGYSCREIGQRLGIPDGTVKRILHESRENLRRSMGVTGPRMKGEPAMSTTSKWKAIPQNNLVWWLTGDTGPGQVMDSALAKAICLAANKTAKTVAQISEAVDANPTYVQEAVDSLTAEALLEKSGRDRYRTSFAALSADDYIELTDGIREHGVRLADILEPHLPELEEAWNRTAVPGQGYSWQDGIWPVLAMFTLIIDISRRLLGEPEPPVRASGRRYWMGAHEPVPEEHRVWITGFNSMSATDGQLNYGYFWSWGFSRESAPIGDMYIRSLLSLVAEGVSDYEAIAARSERTVDQVRESLAKLIEKGIVRRDGDTLSITFPVFRQPDNDILLPVVDALAAISVRESIGPATEDVSVRLRQMGYGHLEEQFPVWRMWLSGNIGGEALRELLRRGVLPDPGSPAPARFALVGWYGNLPLVRWRQPDL